MSIANPDLESYLKALGDAVVFIGDPFTANGLEAFGAKEGDISIAWNPTYNPLTFPEYTGEQVHESSLQGINPQITIPTIISNEALWEKFSATGSEGGGFSFPQPVVETSLVLVPLTELIAAGEDGFAAGASGWEGTPAVVPVNWFWFWRVHLQMPDFAFRNPDGGKSIGNVIVQTMYDKDRPQGQKVWTRGNPLDYDIDEIRI